jgi:thioester reductase-like protein
MCSGRGTLLTGATGLLGRYLLRELLLAGHQVTVLARDARGIEAVDRIRELVAFWSEELGRRLPEPAVIRGDLRAERIGLDAASRRWLASHCQRVIHAAAHLAFCSSLDGEPWATNVLGTRNLLACCQSAGIAEFHHISTAFVCGDDPGPILEEDVEGNRRFRNVYEQSKAEAERLVRAADGIRSTIYRPSIIVGDSHTGYTCTYHGVYRILALGARLAEGVPCRLELQLPLTGEEPCNLVPVDWVAQAIVALLDRTAWHGHVFHLTARRPVPIRLIKEVAEGIMEIEGVCFAGSEIDSTRTPLEQFFFESLADYWPYLHGDPIFDRRNLDAALPNLPAAEMDGTLLARLTQFAVADGWGRNRRGPARASRPQPASDCRNYVEKIFPAAARRSPLAQAAGLNVVVTLDVRGEGGGQWTFRWIDGELASVRRGLEAADVRYRTDPSTFEDVIGRRRSPQAAFGDRLIEIEGDVEKGLKLAVLFGTFLADGELLGEEANDVVLEHA